MENAAKLQALDFPCNFSVGEIPKELGNLTSLNLSRNHLSGTIPSETSSLVEVASIDLSVNRLNISIPPSIGCLSSLFLLDLSNNLLSGGLPMEIGKLKHLSELDLSNNSLSNGILPEVNSSKRLVSLNLSHIHLPGFVNNCFKEMLGYTKLAYEFLGPILNTSAFVNAPINALQGNSGLCGNVKKLQLCLLSSLRNPKRSSKDEHNVVLLLFPNTGVGSSATFYHYYIHYVEKRER